MLKFCSIVAVVLCAAGYFAFVITEPSSGQQLATKLYSLQSAGKPAAEAEKSSVASVREAEIVFGSDARDLVRQQKLTLPLFDGQDVEAVVTNAERRSADDVTWRGKIEYGRVDGEAIITFRKGHYSGLIYGPTSTYEIVPRGNRHVLVELDQTRFPDCGGAVTGDDQLARTRSSGNLGAGVDSGDRIDVLVVYTTATKTFLGGDAQAQALAQAAIDATNTSYINSKIRQRVRMVHVQEYLYTESGNSSTDLTNLRNDPLIQGLRNTHNADLVAEISEVTGVCGIGNLMGPATGNANNAFTVTARNCAVGNLSFAHELGHNMASHHNPENGGTAAYPYGYGHYVNGNYRTVMSYSDPCTSGCTRRPYFSNPNVIFNGAPTGINNARDNARSINNTADVVAAYRYSGSSITMSNFNAGDWLPRLVTRNLTWSSDNITGNVRIEISRDESTNWETLIESTPNDGSEPITTVGRATRRARVRVVSVNAPTVSDSSVRNISIR